MSSSNWDFSKYVDPPAGQPGPAAGEASSAYPVPSSPANTGYLEDDLGPIEGEAIHAGHPPVIWLGGSAVAAIAGGVLAGFLGASLTWALVAWCLCGPIAIGLLAAFSAFDTRQRARAALYSEPSWVKPAYVGALVLCGLAILGCSLRIAFWVGRL